MKRKYITYGLSINTPMSWGINKGFTILEIFKYIPSYIEWLMKDTDYYVYNRELNQLINPYPFYEDMEISEYFLEKKKGFPLESLGYPYKRQSLDYALSIMKEYNVQPKPYSFQMKSQMEKSERVMRQAYPTLLELHRLDPTFPKPGPIFSAITNEPIMFRFSDEALKYNKEKEEWENLEGE